MEKMQDPYSCWIFSQKIFWYSWIDDDLIASTGIGRVRKKIWLRVTLSRIQDERKSSDMDYLRVALRLRFARGILNFRRRTRSCRQIEAESKIF